jgi:CheY-like chemotaxis protein
MLTKPKLLVVEDDQDLREVMLESLGFIDAQIISAENGAMALEMIESFNPDLILSDFNMPIMNGLEMLKNLRQKGCQTPVILLSGYSSSNHKAEAKEWGAWDFLDKPFEIDKLTEILVAGLAFGKKLKKTVHGVCDEK